MHLVISRSHLAHSMQMAAISSNGSDFMKAVVQVMGIHALYSGSTATACV
jgi:hypothetical protein